MIRKGFLHLLIFSFFAILTLALIASRHRVDARWIGRPAPEIENEVWINSPPLRLENLRGKVVLLEFWTYG